MVVGFIAAAHSHRDSQQIQHHNLKLLFLVNEVLKIKYNIYSISPFLPLSTHFIFLVNALLFWVAKVVLLITVHLLFLFYECIILMDCINPACIDLSAVLEGSKVSDSKYL